MRTMRGSHLTYNLSEQTCTFSPDSRSSRGTNIKPVRLSLYIVTGLPSFSQTGYRQSYPTTTYLISGPQRTGAHSSKSPSSLSRRTPSPSPAPCPSWAWARTVSWPLTMRCTRWGRGCRSRWICGALTRSPSPPIALPAQTRPAPQTSMRTRLAAITNQPSYMRPTAGRNSKASHGSSGSSASSRRRRPCWWLGVGRWGSVSAFSFVPFPAFYISFYQYISQFRSPTSVYPSIPFTHVSHVSPRANTHKTQNSPPTSRPCIPQSASRSCTRAHGCCRGLGVVVRKRVGGCMRRVSVSFPFSLGLRTTRCALGRSWCILLLFLDLPTPTMLT
jgi:hypothetical protein